MRTLVPVTLLAALTAGGCTTDLPFNPTEFIQPIANDLDRLERFIDDALADPLNSRPFPLIVGGDSERILYANNLGDIRVRIPGPVNDIVIPGILGPSNLYRHEQKNSDLVRPLILAGGLTGLASDGTIVAYISVVGSDGLAPQNLIVGDLSPLNDKVVYESDWQRDFIWPDLQVDSGRVAFVVRSVDAAAPADRLIVAEVAGATATVYHEGDTVDAFALRGGRLAYVVSNIGETRVFVRELSGDSPQLLAEGLPSQSGPVRVALSNNRVVWSEPTGDGVSRIVAFDTVSGRITVWADAVRGALRGAGDERFVTEEVEFRLPQRANRVVIRRYDPADGEKIVADIPDDGLAGQARVLGDRIAYVNQHRTIVYVPLAGGDKKYILPE